LGDLHCSGVDRFVGHCRLRQSKIPFGDHWSLIARLYVLHYNERQHFAASKPP
jgi:hypothetical protein